MSTQDDPGPARAAQLIDDHRQPPPGGHLFRGSFQRQLDPEQPLVDVGKLERDHAEADAPFPGAAEQRTQPGVEIRFQVGRLDQALAALVFRHVVVADFDRDRANAFAILPHLGHEPIGHAPEQGFDVFLVRRVGGEGLLLAVGFGGLAHGDDRAIIRARGELLERPGAVAEQELQKIERRGRDLANVRQAGGVQAGGGLGADPRQPAVGQRVKKLCLLAAGHLRERGGLVQLRGNLADQLIGGDSLAHRNFQGLANGFANGFGDAHRRGPRSAQVEIAFVNGADLDIGREIVGVGKHPPGEALVFFEVPGQNDQLRAELARPHRRHGSIDAHLPRLVGSGSDDAPLLAAHGDRLAPQARVRRLLHRGEEGVCIEMNDGSGHTTCRRVASICLAFRSNIISLSSLGGRRGPGRGGPSEPH